MSDTRTPTFRDLLLAIRAGAMSPPPAARLIGLRVVRVEPGLAEFALPLTDDHLNGGPVIHGGLIATIVDFALTGAVNDEPITAAVLTANLDVRYLEPVPLRVGELRATGQVLHRTARAATTEARVTDVEGRLYAHATGTVLVRPT